MNFARLASLSFRVIFLVVLIVALFGQTAHAQSTDRNNPTPWPSPDFSPIWEGGAPAQHFYWLEAGPGDLELLVSPTTRTAETAFTVELFNFGFADSDTPLARIAFLPGLDRPESRTERITLNERKRLVVRLTYQGAMGCFHVRLTESGTPATGSSGGSNGSPAVGTPVVDAGTLVEPMIKDLGPGASRINRYSLDAWPGVITLNADAMAARSLTRLRVEILDASNRNLGAVDVTAPSDSPRNAARSITITRRQTLLMQVSLDQNLGPYAVWLDGPAIRPAWHGRMTPMTGGTKGHGDGARHEEFFSIQAERGYVTVNAEITGSGGQGTMQLDVYSENGQDLAGRAVRAASGETVRGSERVLTTAGQMIILRVITDEHVGGYHIWLNGALGR